jgi:hypothetical protein
MLDAGGRAFVFFELDAAGRPVMDPATKKPKIRHTSKIKTFDYSSITYTTSDGRDLVLDGFPEANYAWYTNTQEWSCADAEELVGDKRPSDPVTGNQRCYVETSTTGDYGFGMQVIGFPDGKGLTKWVNNSKPALNDGPIKKLTDPSPFLKPGEVNARLDVPATVNAFKDVAGTFMTSKEAEKERGVCLRNQKGSGWSDLSMHYYCQFPLNQTASGMPSRDCYSRELIAKLTAGSANPHKDAFDKCWANTKFFSDPSLGKARTAALIYIVWNKTGLMDYKIEDQNEAINSFYGVKDIENAHERPRRILDTFPNWIADQPRYNVIRNLQKAMQDKIAAGGSPL